MALLRLTPVRKLFYGCAMVIACLLLFVSASAQAQGAAAIAQGYKTTETNLTPGALMSLKPGSNNAVELANTERVNRLIGLVGSNSLVELGSDPETIQVVTGGVTQALVSDANGVISVGDRITASPIDGIGMKATGNALVVGTAQAAMNIATAKTRTVTATDGSQVNVRIGLVQIQVNVTYYVPPSGQVSFLPAFLQDFANAVSGKEVSPVRVIISALILILAFICIAVLLYSTVRSSIISIGRNPLSEKAVNKSILQIGITVIGILLLTLITIYLILTT